MERLERSPKLLLKLQRNKFFGGTYDFFASINGISFLKIFMGASLSIVKSYEVKQIYEFSFLYGCEFALLIKVSIAELEYLHKKFQEISSLQTPISNALSRVLVVLFQIDDISQLSFEIFLQVFNSWKVSSSSDKLECKSCYA